MLRTQTAADKLPGFPPKLISQLEVSQPSKYTCRDSKRESKSEKPSKQFFCFIQYPSLERCLIARSSISGSSENGSPAQIKVFPGLCSLYGLFSVCFSSYCCVCVLYVLYCLWAYFSQATPRWTLRSAVSVCDTVCACFLLRYNLFSPISFCLQCLTS